MLAVDQHAADRRVGPAVMRIVVDAQDGAVFEPDARRALDLREQHVDRVAQPADFQMPAVERAVLDLAAVVIRHDLAAADAAADVDALAGKRSPSLRRPDDHEIGRPAIQRRGELAGRHARAVDDRLVIAGEKACRYRRACVMRSGRKLSSKNFRAPSSSSGIAATRALADVAQDRHRDRGSRRAPVAPGVERAAACRERPRTPRHDRRWPSRRASAHSTGSYCVSGNLIGSRLWRRRGRRARKRPSRHEARSSASADRKPGDRAAIGLTVRLRSRPASSSDRARRHRARTSTHR